MTKILRFVVDIPIKDVYLGDLEGMSLDDISAKIHQAVIAISKSEELREEYAKCFREELGAHVDSYISALKAINVGLNKAQIVEIEEEE